MELLVRWLKTRLLTIVMALLPLCFGACIGLPQAEERFHPGYLGDSQPPPSRISDPSSDVRNQGVPAARMSVTSIIKISNGQSAGVLSSFDYGMAIVGSREKAVFTFRNTGNIAAQSVSFSLSSNSFVSDNALSTCVGTIEPGVSCVVHLDFAPLNASALSGDLELSYLSQSSNIRLSIALSGQGVPSQWTSIDTIGAPSGRRQHLSAWTGNTGNPATQNRLIVYGGQDASGTLSSGSIYNPATNAWSAMSEVNGPSVGPWIHTDSAIWTGNTGNPTTSNRFFVWGGGGSSSRFGGLYDLETNTWTQTAPSSNAGAGTYFQMVWTGNTGSAATDHRVIIGPRYGSSGISAQIYNPATNIWTTAAASPTIATLTNEGPGRWHYSSVWTGSTGNVSTSNRMILWGGATGANSATNKGAIYDPASNTWAATSTVGAPSARYWNGAVWTGNTGIAATENRMIIWGGVTTPAGLPAIGYGDGAVYNPATDSWTAISSVNAPTARWDFECHWDGRRMLVWGGAGSTAGNITGKFYDLETNTWSDAQSFGNPNLIRYIASVFTGSSYIFWGGEGGNPRTLYRQEGGMFTPSFTEL